MVYGMASRHGMVYDMAWRAWQDIWYGMVYGMARQAWHFLWYGLASMARYFVWPGRAWRGIWYYMGRHGMIYGMFWHMLWPHRHMVWPGGRGMVYGMAWLA